MLKILRNQGIQLEFLWFLFSLFTMKSHSEEAVNVNESTPTWVSKGNWTCWVCWKYWEIREYNWSFCYFYFHFSLLTMKSHAEEDLNPRALCGRKIISRNHSKVHNKINTWKNPYHCTMCGKGLISRNHKTKHMKSLSHRTLNLKFKEVKFLKT